MEGQSPGSELAAGRGWPELCCQVGLAQHPASARVPHSVKAQKEEKEWRPGKKNEEIQCRKRAAVTQIFDQKHHLVRKGKAAAGVALHPPPINAI